MLINPLTQSIIKDNTIIIISLIKNMLENINVANKNKHLILYKLIKYNILSK